MTYQPECAPTCYQSTAAPLHRSWLDSTTLATSVSGQPRNYSPITVCITNRCSLTSRWWSWGQVCWSSFQTVFVVKWNYLVMTVFFVVAFLFIFTGMSGLAAFVLASVNSSVRITVTDGNDKSTENMHLVVKANASLQGKLIF